jgi:hypothetical protein
MIDPHEPCPPAHLPPERLAVLGLLTPFLFGVVVCSFIYFPPLLGCVVALLVFGWMKGKATVWRTGFKHIRLHFRAVDAWTGQPIPGAKVVLFIPTDTGPSQEACTGSDGTASVMVLCQVLVKRGIFGISSFPCLDRWWFKVAANGYEGTGREWLDLYTIWNQGVENPDPPPIRVELKRRPGRTAGK